MIKDIKQKANSALNLATLNSKVIAERIQREYRVNSLTINH